MWREDGNLLTDAGDVGGDDQVSPAFSRRFLCVENPQAIVTVHTYVVRSKQNIENNEWDVEEQIEYLVGEDPDCPADTEIWSSYDYDRGSINGQVLYSEAEAYNDALRRIRRWTPDTITWDGEPVR
jgi:hypothetical protein